MLEIAGEDFIVTARAIGYSENRIAFKYALKNALLPPIALAGLNLGLILGGALVTETVFSWPGTGRLMLEAAYQRDYPVMMGVFVIISVCVILANLLADLGIALLDPRVIYK
jgi:peptide/nickel transport system permease protein